MQLAGPKVEGEPAARAAASNVQIRGGVSSSTGAAPAADIEMSMHAAELMQITPERNG